jgi:hypothetical protein
MSLSHKRPKMTACTVEKGREFLMHLGLLQWLYGTIIPMRQKYHWESPDEATLDSSCF